MSLRTIQQLHADLQQITRKDQYAEIDKSSIALFNANLKEAKTHLPPSDVLSAIPVADKDTPATDLLIYAGQLKAVWEDHDVS